MNKVAKSDMEAKQIMEVTTFNINSEVDPMAFAKRDAEVESDFTSKQPGFVKRQSGIDDKGNYAVIVFWESMANAEASMSKFMGDASVADYAQMIDGPSMKMARYAMDKAFDAKGSRFVEVMAFDLQAGTDIAAFDALNHKVETDVTAKREGFLQRLTGSNEEGKQVVAVYWASKATSDAALQPFMNAPLAKDFMKDMVQSSIVMGRYKFLNLEPTNKEKAIAVLNSFNTGDQTALTAYVDANKYIQHNLSAPDGAEAFAGMVQMGPSKGFSAEVIRSFEDGEYVFTHSKYNFFGPQVGFDVFRFENGLIVEHWDNLLPIQEPNPSGRTQLDGAIEVTDLDKTAANKQTVRGLIENVFMKGEMDKVTSYFDPEYLQHNPAVGDGLEGLQGAMQSFAKNGMVMEYSKLHKVLGQGNFVLTLSEGKFGKNEPTSFYDLFRLEGGKIVEHWDVIAPIPPKSAWKNDNGKF